MGWGHLKRLFRSLPLGTRLRHRLAGLLPRRTLPFHHLSGWKDHFQGAPPQCPDPAPRVEIPSLDNRQQRSHGRTHALRQHRHLPRSAGHVMKARRRLLLTSPVLGALCGWGVAVRVTAVWWWESWLVAELCTSYSKWETASRRRISFEMSWG